MGWRPLRDSWLKTLPSAIVTDPALVSVICDLTEWILDPTIAFLRKNCTEVVSTADIMLADTCMRLFESSLDAFKESNKCLLAGKDAWKLLQGAFAFSVVWSVGGAVNAEVSFKIAAILRCHVAW